jgi:CDP-diglyceride synthetase
MRPDPYFCTLYLLLAFTAAGVMQTVWLRSAWSRRWAKPLDGGKLWRGRRLFGDHKTWTGFIVMIPATAIAFWGVAWGFGELSESEAGSRWWGLTWRQYLLLGAWAGLGFMLGELPNSFLKRRFDVAPGQKPRDLWLQCVGFIADQADSVVGALLALICFVSVPWQTWVLLVVAGPVVHWLFNVVLWLLGVKKRAA